MRRGSNICSFFVLPSIFFLCLRVACGQTVVDYSVWKGRPDQNKAAYLFRLFYEPKKYVLFLYKAMPNMSRPYSMSRSEIVSISLNGGKNIFAAVGREGKEAVERGMVMTLKPGYVMPRRMVVSAQPISFLVFSAPPVDGELLSDDSGLRFLEKQGQPPVFHIENILRNAKLPISRPMNTIPLHQGGSYVLNLLKINHSTSWTPPNGAELIWLGYRNGGQVRIGNKSYMLNETSALQIPKGTKRITVSPASEEPFYCLQFAVKTILFSPAAATLNSSQKF